MNELSQKFLDYLAIEKNYSKHTIRNYQNDLKVFQLFLKKLNYKIEIVDYTIIRQFLQFLHEKNYNSRTINRQLSTLRSFFKYLKMKNFINNNPLELVSNKRTDKNIPTYLHYYEVEKLLAVPDTTLLGTRDKLILEILYSTGIRVGELVNIKIADIDLNEKTIKILGKGNRERIAIFGDSLAGLFKNYLAIRHSINKSNSDFLLLNKNGLPLTDRGVRLIIEKIASKTDIVKTISPHTLRHTFATHMLDNGADLKVVQELLGHESIGSTGIYTHVSNEKLRDEYRKNHPRAKRSENNG